MLVIMVVLIIWGIGLGKDKHAGDKYVFVSLRNQCDNGNNVDDNDNSGEEPDYNDELLSVDD